MIDPLDIDSNGFDPQKYVTNFLKSHSIQELIKKNNSVQQEIKNYDQEIQSLVFQNYSRFISSIDTVKKMKNDIFKVDDKMKVLEDSMNKVTALANKVDDALSVKRGQISKLNTIKVDLEKLNMLCRFPEILAGDISQYQTMIEHSEVIYSAIFTNTVQAYRQCFNKLDEFQEEPLVKPIYKDSIDKIEEIRSILWKLQNTFKPHSSQLLSSLVKPPVNQVSALNVQELRHVTLKLTQIMQDQESVLRNYLKITKERFSQITMDIVNAALTFAFTSSSTNGLNQNNNNNANQVVQLQEKLDSFLAEKKYMVSLDELTSFYKKSESELIAKESVSEGSIIWLINALINQVFSQLKEELEYLYRDISPAITRFPQKEEVIEQTIREIFLHILEEIKKKMSKKITNIEVSECLRALSVCFQEVVFSNNNLKRSFKTSVSDKFAELSEKVCRGQILNCYTSLRNEFLILLVDAKQQCIGIEKNLQRIASDFAETETTVYREISAVTAYTKNKLDCLVQWACLQLKSFLFSDTQYLRIDDIFIGLLHSQMVDFVRLVAKFLSLRPNFVSLEHLVLLNNQAINPQQSKETNPQFLELLKTFQSAPENTLYFIFANQFLAIFENKLISKTFETLAKTHQPSILALARTTPGLKEFYEDETSQIAGSIIPRLKQASLQEHSLNYVNYCQCLTEQILQMLFSYFEGAQWQKQYTSSPTEISPQIVQVCERVRTILLELDLFFLDSKRGLAKKGSLLKVDSGVMIEMERLIVKKSRVFDVDKLEFNRNSLLMSLLKGLLKALIERVRGIRCFNKFGLQTLQADMYFLIQVFYEMVAVDDESFVIATYFEIIESAKDSTIDIQLLDVASIEGLSNAKRLALKL